MKLFLSTVYIEKKASIPIFFAKANVKECLLDISNQQVW
jgi:hypothetical protein